MDVRAGHTSGARAGQGRTTQEPFQERLVRRAGEAEAYAGLLVAGEGASAGVHELDAGGCALRGMSGLSVCAGAVVRGRAMALAVGGDVMCPEGVAM